MRILLNFFMLCIICCGNLNAQIYESFDIRDLLSFADKETLVVTDLNHVLMETVQPLGSDHWAAWEVKRRMGETGETKLEVLHKMVPMWHHILMESDFKSVEKTTASVVRRLQQQGNVIVGLTARYTEMAYPTIQQLHSINIDLSLHSLSHLDHEIEGGYAAKYLEGIIFVGLKNDKGETLMRLLDQLEYQPKKILFIDDKEKNLKSVEAACVKRKIPFTGLRYGYLDKAEAEFDPNITKRDLENYLKHRNAEYTNRVMQADKEVEKLEKAS